MERVPTGFTKKEKALDAGWGFSKKTDDADRRAGLLRYVDDFESIYKTLPHFRITRVIIFTRSMPTIIAMFNKKSYQS